MEGKYGRLFTEADVLRLVAAARQAGPFVERDAASLDAWARACLDAYDGDLPREEPLFLLRAQDKITPGVVASYVGGTYAHGCSEEHRRSAEEAYERIHAWQTVHPDRVKVPD